MNLSNIYNRWLTTAESANKTAIICGDRKCSYRTLDQQVNRYATALQSIGIKEGDRVGFLMDNSLEIIFAFFACFRLKAIAVPMKPNSPPDEILFSADHCRIKILLADADLIAIMDKIKEQLPHLENIYATCEVSNKTQKYPSFTSLVEKQKDCQIQIPKTEPDTPAVIFYTSGTTSKPKGVTHTHNSLTNAALNRCHSLNHKDTSSFLTSSFLCHASAMTIILLPMLHCGGTALFMEEFSADKFAYMIYNTPATNAVASPHQWRELLDKGVLDKPAESLEYATSGGNTVPLKLRQDFKKATGVPLTSGLGMTECGGYMAAYSENHPPQALGSPIWNTEVRLVDINGNDVEHGEIGEILIRTNSMMSGYWNDLENTKNAFSGEWFRSGDLARQDPEGFYYFAGRCKTTIIVGTSNVAPGEVEDILDAHPAIKQAVIVPVPDPETTQALFAFIQLNETNCNISGEELKRYAAARLATHKIPKHYHFTDKLEVSGILEKIDRNVLTAKAETLITDNILQNS